MPTSEGHCSDSPDKIYSPPYRRRPAGLRWQKRRAPLRRHLRRPATRRSRSPAALQAQCLNLITRTSAVAMCAIRAQNERCLIRAELNQIGCCRGNRLSVDIRFPAEQISDRSHQRQQTIVGRGQNCQHRRSGIALLYIDGRRLHQRQTRLESRPARGVAEDRRGSRLPRRRRPGNRRWKPPRSSRGWPSA